MARFTVVDALRGIAALGVVLYHAVEGGHIPALFAAMPGLLQIILTHANSGVAIFFVLSGFVIAHSLGREPLTVNAAARFMLRRSIRLDPPYWAAMALAIAFSVLASAMVKDRAPEHFSASQIAAHLFYLQDLLHFKDINPVFWTLCLEVQFYLVFAALLLTRSRTVLFSAFAVSLLWPLGLATAPDGLFVNLWFGFLLGGAAYYAWHDARARPWFYAYVAILFAAMIYRGNVFGAVCCLTAVFLYISARLDLIYTWLNWRWIQFLGMISYSLYLIHGPITGAAFRVGFILTGHSIWSEALWWVVSIAASIIAAATFYFLIEWTSIRLSRFVPSGKLSYAEA